jgi:putative membrane protein
MMKNSEATNSKLILAKKLNIIAYIVSIVVIGLVLLMRRVKLDVGIDFSFLPAFHSTMNAVTAVLLIIALYYIKQKNITAHRNMMFAAMITSALFLLSYVLYHFTTPETNFCKEGSIRIVYFILLISHVILAGVIFPFILFTLIRGYTMQVEKHKRMAKWVFPLWLYVAITGPILYLMLRPCYGM